jgi:hypothetical protein
MFSWFASVIVAVIVVVIDRCAVIDMCAVVIDMCAVVINIWFGYQKMF